MTHKLSLKRIEPVTHDTNHLVFDRPEGYDFTPGQATELAVLKDGWEDEKRPFTFTSLPDDDNLEFIIKSYPSHDGVTEQIGKLNAGDHVAIDDPWGAISDKGEGTFIAGGAGITPFIAILRRRLKEMGHLNGYRLVFSNKCEKDIILREEFAAMPGLKTDFLLTEEDVAGMHHGEVDADFLDAAINDYAGIFYLCGPPSMENEVAALLAQRGVTEDCLVREEN